MKRLVVFGSIAVFTVLVCHGQEVAEKAASKPGKTAQSSSLLASAEVESTTESEESSIPSSLKTKPKSWQVGGSLIDLVSSQAASNSATDESDAPTPLKGLQLLNPFAPVTNKPQSPLNWKARRGDGFRFQSPKEGEPEGIKLFFLGF